MSTQHGSAARALSAAKGEAHCATRVSDNSLRTTQVVEEPDRALNAGDAGRYLAVYIGLPKPILARRMWQLGRRSEVATVRLGRSLQFRMADLRAFADQGGCSARASRVGL